MYVELKEDQNFTDTFPTWIIAYCLDTDSFFATNQRYFFWEHETEFKSEEDAIDYFKKNINEFINARKEILTHTGGWKINKPLFLENIRESFD